MSELNRIDCIAERPAAAELRVFSILEWFRVALREYKYIRTEHRRLYCRALWHSRAEFRIVFDWLPGSSVVTLKEDG